MNAVVLGTDFSDRSARAREVAVEYARRLGAVLHVVHVEGWACGAGDESMLRGEVDAIHDTPAVGHLLSGTPATELTRYARDCDAQLLVVGTHGRTGLGHLLLGSVAERVLRLAHCPVLIVPSWSWPHHEAAPPSGPAVRCLVCNSDAEDRICDRCRALIRGEAIMRQQEESRKAR
jgi:nucleotide-binding universal stress UspA family protein